MEKEKQHHFSRGRVFFSGFLAGIAAMVLIFIGLAGYAIRYPQKVMVKAFDAGVSRVVDRMVESIPRDVIAVRQSDIVDAVTRITQAYSENCISSADIRMLSKNALNAAADKKVTREEMDELFRLVQRMTLEDRR
jgi:hypothetical protein